MATKEGSRTGQILKHLKGIEGGKFTVNDVQIFVDQHGWRRSMSTVALTNLREAGVIRPVEGQTRASIYGGRRVQVFEMGVQEEKKKWSTPAWVVDILFNLGRKK